MQISSGKGLLKVPDDHHRHFHTGTGSACLPDLVRLPLSSYFNKTARNAWFCWCLLAWAGSPCRQGPLRMALAQLFSTGSRWLAAHWSPLSFFCCQQQLQAPSIFVTFTPNSKRSVRFFWRLFHVPILAASREGLMSYFTLDTSRGVSWSSPHMTCQAKVGILGRTIYP